MSTATVKPTTVRIEEGLKEQATEFLDSVGLSLNSYLNLAVRQLVNQRKIPFEIVGRAEVPNEATRRAMVIAEAHELGILPDDSPSFNDADELISFLDEGQRCLRLKSRLSLRWITNGRCASIRS